MTTRALERKPSGRAKTTPHSFRQEQPEPMSLRTDLYLIAHDDDTGRPHLDKEAIAVGLAATVLLELGHAGRVRLGSRQSHRHGTRKRHHGQTTLLDATPTGDAINDAALTLLWRLGGTVDTQRFIRELATTDLYHQVRDHLIASGVLRSVTRRRYWFFRTACQLPARATDPVRARMRIRNVARLYRPRPHDITLAALVTALGLAPYLNLPDASVAGVYLRLAELVGPEHPLHHVTSAIRPHRIRYQ